MKKSSKRAVEIGAGVATAAALAAAAGAYLLSGKEGAKRKAKAKAWVVKARQEAARRIKAAKRISAAEYAQIAGQAVKRYGELHDATGPEIIKAAKDLKAEWKRIQADAKKMTAAKRLTARKQPRAKTSAKSRSARRKSR